jgi:hypothetical protein
VNRTNFRAPIIETLKHPIVAMLAKRKVVGGDGVIANA